MEEKETMGVMPEATQSATAEGVKEAISLTPKPEYREYGEDMAERREGRRVIRMEGGRTKLVLSSEAEEYRDTDGNWQDTDNTLEYRAAEEDDFAGYETKGNRYRVRLPENAKNAILMRVQEGESRLDIRLKERCRTANGALASRKGKVVNYERSVGEKGRKCGEIGYRDIFEKTDVRYNLEGGKIKESLVVKERRESYRYEFCIETTQAELVREETGAILIQHGEEQLFRIPEAFMEDANGEVSNAVTYELEEESAGHYHFAIVADAEWMNAEERAFPVLIDPTLIKETGVTLRCVGRTTKTKYNAAGVACGTETVYATESVNKVGKSGNTVYRSYVNFDLGSVAAQDILDAKLMLKLSNEEEPELHFFCARATQSTQNTVDFVNKTAAKDTFSYKLIWGNNLQAEMDITSIVREWRNGESNFGIVLYADETVDGILTITNTTLQITCQSQRSYHGYTVTTLYDSLMHVVKSCAKRNSDENYFATTYNYSTANQLVSTVDPNGIETVNNTDTVNNDNNENEEKTSVLEKITQKGNLKLRETSEYDDGDYLIRSVNTNGSETTFDYNTDGSLKSATLPSEQTISYAYNTMGQLLSLTANVDGKLNTNSITYKYGYVTKLRHGSTTYDFTYDGYGRVRTVKAGGMTVLTNTYTDFGTNLDGVSGAVSRVVSKDALGNTVTAYADKYGRVIASKKNNEELTKEVYDLAGNLTQHIDNELGVSYNYTYNEHNQVTEYTEKKGTSTRVKTSCTYDTYYRPMTSTYTVNGKSYSYSCGYANSLGDELSSFTTPLGTVTYTRDDLKRLKSKRYTCKNVSALQSYTYAPNRADGTYTSQLVKNLNFTVGSNVQRLSYTYDASGNITAIEDNAGAVASYEYDGLGRLTRENISGKKTVVYSYDGAGNLTSKKEYAYTTGALGAIKATHSYQYAGGTWCDRLTFYDGACITYNAAGYPTCYRGREVTWYRRRAASIGDTTFAYNDSGIRIRKGTTEYFTYGNLILAEKRGSTVIHYYYDDSGVAGFEYNGQKYFYRKNLQGDIIGIYDSCWNLLGQYEYDAWGNLLSQIGSEILNINPFRYRGYYYDAETGLYYLNSRYYDPETGRFISPDSLKYLDPTYNNGLNLYTYCGNNPVMHVDPNGHEWWDWLLGGLVFAGLLFASVAFSAFAAAAVATKAAAGLIVALKASAAVLTGAALAGGASLTLQFENSKYGAIDFDWEQFKVDIIIGAISGFVSYGVGEMFKPIGALFGKYISQMQIGNYPLTRFVPMDVFTTIGGGIVSVVCGMAAGLQIEEQLSRTIGSGDLSPLSARIAESIQSEVFSRIVDFILDMVM